MIPYASFTYFGILLYAVVPAIVLAFLVKRIRVWLLVATAGMLAIQYSDTFALPPRSFLNGFWALVAYVAIEVAVIVAFSRLRAHGKRRGPFYVAVAIGILPLVLVKAQPHMVPAASWGFLGISYITFRVLDVIFSIQDGLVTTVQPAKLLGFLCAFPTISSGPIDRYKRFSGDWDRARTPSDVAADIDAGVHRIMTGFLYKFLIAALIKQYWLDPVSGNHSVFGTISYMYAYSGFLFFDFAGYSLFAVGVSYLFGIRVHDNFNRPFLATNIQDFWNRWHISLSLWMRDRVYRRFGLAALRGKWFKNDNTVSYVGFFLSFGLMGLWHGIEPYFLLYGLYHAVLLSFHQWFSQWNSVHGAWKDGPVWRAGATVLTFHAVCFGFLLFSGHIGPTTFR